MFVRPEHALEALAACAGGSVAAGSTGGGNGMICDDFKGGAGTASRLVAIEGLAVTVEALVQATHGVRPWLTSLARPVGRMMAEGGSREPESSSVIVILATGTHLSAPGGAVRAIRGEGTRLPVRILCSSVYGAQLAAHLGLSFAFALHFAPAMDEQALAVHRAGFRPSERLQAPHAMVAVCAADTDAEAAYLRSSQLLGLRTAARRRTRPAGPSR
ncbi:MAG: P1 family peptidase [Rubrimonas sp.]